jgi:hypothetical protein
MDYVVRKHSKPSFYNTFCKWLVDHKFPVISDVILPENVFVCYVDEKPIYCIWLYFTDSKLCWIAFPASNKNIDYAYKKGGMDYLLETVLKYCKKKKILTVITTSNTKSIEDSLINSGFALGDEGVNHYLKTI